MKEPPQTRTYRTQPHQMQLKAGRSLDNIQELLVEGQVMANLVTDAHLAALAVEHGCELISTDTDFSRFPRINWRNPLKYDN